MSKNAFIVATVMLVLANIGALASVYDYKIIVHEYPVFVGAGAMPLYFVAAAALYNYKRNLAIKYYEGSTNVGMREKVLFAFLFPIAYNDDDFKPVCIETNNMFVHAMLMLVAPVLVAHSVLMWATVGLFSLVLLLIMAAVRLSSFAFEEKV